MRSTHHGGDSKHAGQFGLRLPQSLLRLFALGDVLGDTGKAIDLAFSVVDRKPTVPDPAHGSVRTNDSVLVREGKAIYECLPDRLAVIGMDRVQEGIGGFIQTLAGAAPHLFICRAHIEESIALRVSQVERFADVLCQLTETLLTRTQLSFRLFALGDVMSHASDDRRRNSLGTKRVVILPDLPLSGPRDDGHHPLVRAVRLDSGQV